MYISKYCMYSASTTHTHGNSVTLNVTKLSCEVAVSRYGVLVNLCFSLLFALVRACVFLARPSTLICKCDVQLLIPHLFVKITLTNKVHPYLCHMNAHCVLPVCVVLVCLYVSCCGFVTLCMRVYAHAVQCVLCC